MQPIVADAETPKLFSLIARDRMGVACALQPNNWAETLIIDCLFLPIPLLIVPASVILTSSMHFHQKTL
jgi:hypothetical protein